MKLKYIIGEIAMSNEKKQIFTVCDQSAVGAVELYDAIDGKACLYAAKKAYGDEEYANICAELAQLSLRTTAFTGLGDGYGSPYDYEDTKESAKEIDEENLIVDGVGIVGCVHEGEWISRGTPEGSKRYKRSIYIPIGSAPIMTDCRHYLDVFIYDGTSSESVEKIFASIERVK